MKNNIEAAKCFQQALKFEPDNIQILRDACNLYLHTREFKLHQDMRRKFLVSKSSILSNYSGFALSCHLMGDYKEAGQAMDSLIVIAEADKNFPAIEFTNVCIYKVFLLKESNQNQQIIEFLDKYDSKILNVVYKLKTRAQAYLNLNNFDKAQEICDKLLHLQPENEKFINLYLDSNTNQNKESLLLSLKQKYPSRFLNFLIMKKTNSCELFKEIFQKELDYNCKRFIPSFFSSLREICDNVVKRKIVHEVLLSALDLYRENEQASPAVNSDHTSIEIDPTCELFLLYTLASFLCYVKDYKEALKICEEAMKHTPSFEDSFVLQSKIFKKTGLLKESASKAEEWYKMSIGDKGLNTKAVHYMLHANENVKGDNLFKRFMKEEKIAEKNIHELQMLDYEVRMANSYSKELKWPLALSLLNIAEKNVDEIYDDQHDFYTFCFRKYTILPLYKTIKFNDAKFKSSKIYLKIFSKYYLNLHLAMRYNEFEKNKELGLKNDQEALKKYVEEKKEIYITNTIEFPVELEEAIDLSGKKLVETLDFNRKMAETAKRLIFVDDSLVKDSLKYKVYKVLFLQAKATSNLNEMTDCLEKISRLKTRCPQIKVWIEVLLKKIELAEPKLEENQLKEILKKVDVFKIHANFELSGDHEIKSILDILVLGTMNNQTEQQISLLLSEYLRKMTTETFLKFSYEKKKTIMRLVREHCFDQTLVLGFFAAKNQTHLLSQNN